MCDAAGRVVEWNAALAAWAGERSLDGTSVVDLLGRDAVGAPAGRGAAPIDVEVVRAGVTRRAVAHVSGLSGDDLGRLLVVLVDRPGPAAAGTGELRAPRIVQWSELAGSLRPLAPSAVCATFGLVGLDAVNASYSRSTGDLVLSQIAARLAEVAPPGAVVERTGGERFVVVVAEADVPAGGWAPLLVALRAPVDTPLGRVAVGASVGVAAGDPRSALVLLDASERRLDSALRRGAGIVEAERMLERTARPTARYSGELVEAVAAGGVRAHFQPVVDLLTSRVVEFEALARWDGAQEDRREASAFISAAEDTGVIVPMGEGVLRDAVELARSVASTIGDRSFAVSVNVSIRELLDHGFVDAVDDRLRAGGVAPRCLQLEVPADVPATDPGDVARRIAELRRLGVRVALDNVGGPNSSLLVVRDLVVDVVKLDPSIVTRLGDDPRAEPVLRSLLDLGRQLGVAVVAKGVERADQHDRLRQLGCRFAQGYHYGGVTPALDLPFDDLVGPPIEEHRAVEERAGDDRAGEHGGGRAFDRDELVPRLIGAGAFDHALLDDVVGSVGCEIGARSVAVGVVERGRVWVASGVDADERIRGAVAEAVACGGTVGARHAPGPEEPLVVAVPVELTGGAVVAGLGAVWEPRADRSQVRSIDDLVERLSGAADEVAARIELRARIAGVGSTGPAASDDRRGVDALVA